MSDPDPQIDQPKNNLSEGDFMRLLMRNEPALRAYSRSLLPDWNTVDEVIQEASITLWEKFSQLRDEAGFLPWAKVIVRFKCLSAISTMKRDRHVFSDAVLELIADEAAMIETEEQVAAHQALRRCLQSFSSHHQELMLAPYLGRGRIKEMAESTGRSSNSLYKLLARLREKLSNCIQRSLKTLPAQ